MRPRTELLSIVAIIAVIVLAVGINRERKAAAELQLKLDTISGKIYKPVIIHKVKVVD